MVYPERWSVLQYSLSLQWIFIVLKKYQEIVKKIDKMLWSV